MSILIRNKVNVLNWLCSELRTGTENWNKTINFSVWKREQKRKEIFFCDAIYGTTLWRVIAKWLQKIQNVCEVLLLVSESLREGWVQFAPVVIKKLVYLFHKFENLHMSCSSSRNHLLLAIPSHSTSLFVPRSSIMSCLHLFLGLPNIKLQGRISKGILLSLD